MLYAKRYLLRHSHTCRFASLSFLSETQLTSSGDTSWWPPKRLTLSLSAACAILSQRMNLPFHTMSDKEEVIRLNAKIEAYEAQLNAYEEKIIELQRKLQAYEQRNAICSSVENSENPICDAPSIQDNWLSLNPAPPVSPTETRRSPQFQQPSGLEVVLYDHTKSNGTSKKRNPHCISRGPRKKQQQAPRWIAAGKRVLGNVEKAKFSTELFHLQKIRSSELQGSKYERGKFLAKRAASNLHNAAQLATTAQTELFFFLSTLCVLEGQGTFSPDEITGIMDLLDGRSETYRHRRSIVFGAKWFHEKIISALCERGWRLGHAIAVVALSKLVFPQMRYKAYDTCRFSQSPVSV